MPHPPTGGHRNFLDSNEDPPIHAYMSTYQVIVIRRVGPKSLRRYEQVVAATILRSGGLKQDAQPGQAPAPGWSDAADGQP
jgi:hypothetical protein